MEKLAAEKWRETLKSAVEAVVVLRTASTRAFDTEVEGTGNDAGFIVDKQRGIILTNRSVVKPGPVVAEATFHNREEIPVYPLYRDPVHDFGFFRFDPAALQFMKCEEIPLAPEAAAVGLEIRVVGNDGGENLSIMEGTLSRLDRKAPYNGKDVYNDFNTFYMQAASRIKGGSRGSPVIDCDGQAIGLNVGNKKENSAAFFLPLDRVVRALRFIQKFYDTSSAASVHIIPRGTLEMTLVHKGFDEARRLGLQRETEQFVRQAFPGGTGVLVIDSVVPGGPAHKMHLEAGDLLVRVNGEIVTHFLKLETVLDDNVGKRIDLEVERGGVPVKVSLDVEDLHSITPHYFLEVSGGVIHPLSYQQARNFRLECGLVYVAEPGYMLSRAGVPRHAIIQKLARKKITGVEDFISILSNFSRGAQVPLEFVRHVDRHRPKSVLVTVDRDEWFVEPQFYTRDDVTGLWKSRPALISSFAPSSSGGNSSQVIDENISDSDSDNSDSDSYSDFESFLSKCSVDSPESVIEAALVMVEVGIPSSAFIDGVHTEHLSGTGVVIHHSKTMGIVAVDKNTVPIFVSDVTLQFAAYPMAIPGQVVFLHPVHNYALVAYDPAALGPSGAATVRAAQLAPEPALRNGDVVNLVGLNKSLQSASRMCIVKNPVGSRYRGMNMELIELDRDFGTSFSGILADQWGRVQALWGRFTAQEDAVDKLDEYEHLFVLGIPIYAVCEVLQKIIKGTHQGPPLLINGIEVSMPLVRILEVDLDYTLLLKARSFGLSEQWVRRLAQSDPNRLRLLQVKNCWAGSRAGQTLEEGDMLLAIDGEPITSFRDIEKACQGLEDDEGNLKMTVFREGSELELLVGTDLRDGVGSKHIVSWCGSVVQEPHQAVRALGFFPRPGNPGVYVSSSSDGAPVNRYGIYDGEWIIEINGKPVNNLRTFINVIKELKNDEFVRVKTVELNGRPHVFTLKQDLYYWPTWELVLKPETGSWQRNTIKTSHP